MHQERTVVARRFKLYNGDEVNCRKIRLTSKMDSEHVFDAFALTLISNPFNDKVNYHCNNSISFH